MTRYSLECEIHWLRAHERWGGLDRGGPGEGGVVEQVGGSWTLSVSRQLVELQNVRKPSMRGELSCGTTVDGLNAADIGFPCVGIGSDQARSWADQGEGHQGDRPRGQNLDAYAKRNSEFFSDGVHIFVGFVLHTRLC